MSPFAAARPGHFYAVGVGPGAPELVTVGAARLVETAGVLVAPRSEQAGKSLALETVRPWVRAQQVVEHDYPMTRDLERTRACWGGMAGRVADWCGADRSVVQITIGDPLIYSTSSYLLEALDDRLPPERVHVVPGISAFQTVAARFGTPLTLQEDRLTLMPATDLGAVERALDGCETLVLYKAGRVLPALRDLLARRGLAPSSRAIFYAGQGERETVVTDLTGVDEAFLRGVGYMATVIVHVGRRPWFTGEGRA